MRYDGNIAISELDIDFIPEKYGFDANEVNGFIENVKEIGILPFDKIKTNYADNLWDFSAYKVTNTSGSYFRFDFGKAPKCFRENLKNYVLICLIENRLKFSVLYNDINTLCSFFNYCLSIGVIEVKNIESMHVKAWIDSYCSKRSERRKASALSSIVRFCDNYDANFGSVFINEFYKDISKMTNKKIIKAEALNSKTPDIPKDYFDKLLVAIITTINDKNTPVYYRALSCMLLMESQIGIRTGELFDLEVGCMKPITVSSGDKAYYIEYKTWKRHHDTWVISKEISYVNSLFKKGYDDIVKLSDSTRKKLKSNLLFVESVSGQSTKFPVDPADTTEHLNRLFIYYNRYFQTVFPEKQELPELSCVKLPNYSSTKPDKFVVRPVITQFRVHVCSELYAKGCPIQYIEKFMSHLSSEMAYYYVRPQNTVQENLEESTRILREIVTKEAMLIGADKGLSERIDQFIRSNNLSVEKDLDTIVELLLEEMPIRVKAGGVCIKSSRFRECSKDAKTDEFYCAYSVCPNIYTFYYMVDISYSQIKDLCEAIEINRKRGCIKQVQKNINMVHSIVSNKLEPQVKELKRVIKEKGLNHVLERHPQLISVVMNLDDIQKEIDEWKLMTL